MPETPVVPATFVLERTYPAAAARVFAAFAEAAKKRRWYAEGGGGRAVQVFEMDFRVGGSETLRAVMGPRTPVPGAELAYESVFQYIAPGARIVQAQAMDFRGRRVSVSLLTFEFVADGDGCRLTLTHQGVFFEGADGPQMREQGWTALLETLAQALEAA